MNRAEHLEWCKQRAMAYLDDGDVVNAFASFSSDIHKHPETESLDLFLSTVGIFHAANNDIAEMRRFIEGFN